MFHIQTVALPQKCLSHQSISNHTKEWTPPIQKHFDPFTNDLTCVSIRTRLLLGDTFLDLHQRFRPEDVKCETVCSEIAERQGISKEAVSLFALWIVGKDLEIQIRPRANLLQVAEDWPQLVVKYTHYPQAVDPDHMFNRYWLIFRREASVCKKAEREVILRDYVALKMLFGEAKRNIITGRYPCTVKDAVNLAALQLQASIGNYDPMRCPSGYISKNLTMTKSILSSRIIKKKSLRSWEKLIAFEHQRLKDVSTKRAQVCFLDYVRQWRCYGCSFFPVTKDAPPGGFFEFRQQKWMIGVGPDGIVVFERDKNSQYKFIEVWAKLKWTHTSDTIVFHDAFSSRHTYKLITPQSELIHNLCARIAHLVRKGSVKGINASQSLYSPIDDLATVMKFHPASSVILHSSSSHESPVLKTKDLSSNKEALLGSSDTLTPNASEGKLRVYHDIQVSLNPETPVTELDNLISEERSPVIKQAEQDGDSTPAVAVPTPMEQHLESMLVPQNPFIPLVVDDGNTESRRASQTPTYQDVFNEAQVKVDMLHAPSRSRARSVTPLSSFQGSLRSRASSASAAVPTASTAGPKPKELAAALKKSKSDLVDFSFLDF